MACPGENEKNVTSEKSKASRDGGIDHWMQEKNYRNAEMEIR